jgi:hypothetical protein
MTSSVSEVRIGTYWKVSKGYVLVLTPLTEHVFNIATWADDETFEQARPSMINAELLAWDGDCIAYPLPALIDRIEQATQEALAAAQEEYERRHP